MRRHGRGTYRGPGVAQSSFENECPRCGKDIVSWSDATKKNGRWIHKTCAGGGDE